jgi:parvulin-like peptidyl-prolyl isomerase
MIKILRRHRQWLMIVIAILALPFCIYFVKTDYSAIRPDDFARIYDRKVSIVEARHDARLCDLAQALGMSSLVQGLSAGANSLDDRYAQFILNLIILRHEAARLGIRATPSEVADVVRNLGAFRGPSGFDINKYNEFTQNALTPNGLSEGQIEEVAADQLCLNRIKQLVATGVSLPESESKTTYEQAYGRLFVSVIRLHVADFAKDIKLTDDDIRKYYEVHKAELKTEEKRKVELVTLALTDEQKKLTGKERIDVLQKLADRANDFEQALLEKGADFHQVAAKFQLRIETTGEFTAAAPDAKLKTDPQLGTTAFQLTAQEPNSEPVQTPDGFYVLHLAGVVEARPLTIEEAKPKIVDAIKASRAREMLSNKAAKIAHDLRETLKAGTPLSAGLEQANAKAEKLAPFTLMDDIDPNAAEMPKDKPPDFIAVKNAIAAIQPGEVSDFFPWEDGGVIAVLEKREPPDETKYDEKKAAFDERILRNKREIVFYEWLRERQREAGLVATNPEAAGPPRPGARPQPAAPPRQKS